MPIPKKQMQINRTTMRDEVFDTLLSWIMECEIKPGEKLLDKDIAEQLGVSRTPVREAFRRLEDKGLIETSAARGTWVSSMSLKEVDKIYPVVCKLEELAISLCINDLTKNDLNQLERANRRLSLAIKTKQSKEAHQADYEFHEIITNKTDNPYLIDTLKDLKVILRRLAVYYFGGCMSAVDSVHEHTQIIKSLMKKDLSKAQEQMRFNWENSLKRLHAFTD